MTAGGALLRVDNLHAYYGESHVLHGVTLRVHEGECITLLGRNGAGKTTTLRTIVGIVRKRQGVVTLRGRDLLALPAHRVAREGIGYVPEERGIFASLSVEENLLLLPRVAADGMTVERIYELFPNLRSRRKSPGTKLSGGEQQMLAFARVLRAGARFLLLDEPTEGLAPVIVQRIGEVIALLKTSGYTILLVEQNFRFAARYADRHYVMEDGKIVAELAGPELANNQDILHTYLGV